MRYCRVITLHVRNTPPVEQRHPFRKVSVSGGNSNLFSIIALRQISAAFDHSTRQRREPSVCPREESIYFSRMPLYRNCSFETGGRHALKEPNEVVVAFHINPRPELDNNRFCLPPAGYRPDQMLQYFRERNPLSRSRRRLLRPGRKLPRPSDGLS